MPGKPSKKFALPLLCSLLSACAVQGYDAQPISAEGVAQHLDSRSLSSPKLRNFVQGHGHLPEQSWPPLQWDIESLTLVAFFYNPDLEFARAQLSTAQASQITAAQRPNPVLQLPLQRSLNPKDGDSPWTLGLALDIPIETAGKRGYRINEVAHQVTASEFHVANVAWGVRSQLRAQLLALWSSSAKTKLLEQQTELGQRLVSMLEKRLSAGYASALEVNQQKISLIQSKTDLLAAQRDMVAAEVKVAAVLGVRADVLTSVVIDLSGFSQPAPTIPEQKVRLQALLNRADVLEGLAQYEATQAALQLEVARQYPNLHLGPGYTFDQGVRKVGFDFTGLQLPIFNRNEGPIAEARGRRLEAEARVKQFEAKAFAEIDSAVAAYNTTRRMLVQNEAQLVVQHRQLANAQRALKLGQDDRMSVTLAEKAEIVVRLAVLDATFQAQQAVGKIEDAMQRPIFGTSVPYSLSESTK